MARKQEFWVVLDDNSQDGPHYGTCLQEWTPGDGITTAYDQETVGFLRIMDGSKVIALFPPGKWKRAFRT